MFDDFVKKWGREWYLLINSPMWRDARAALDRNAASRNLTAATPMEVATLGVVFAANIQGQMDVLKTMEELMIQPEESGDGQPRETYEADTADEPKPEPKQRNFRKKK